MRVALPEDLHFDALSIYTYLSDDEDVLVSALTLALMALRHDLVVLPCSSATSLRPGPLQQTWKSTHSWQMVLSKLYQITAVLAKSGTTVVDVEIA